MRVLHVITRLIVGGAQENTIASVLGLQKKPGVQVELISGPSTGPEGSLEAAFAASATPLKIIPELVRPIHPWKDCIALRRLRTIFRESRPDIVQTHSGKAGVLGRLAAAQANVPIIIHTIHGPSFGKFQGALPNLLFRAAERRAARVTTHFVTVSDAMTRQYLAAGIGRPGQYTRIFSGFNLEPYLSATNDPRLRQRFGIGPDDVVVGKIARLFKLKGHDDLIDVAGAIADRCPRVKFLLLGDGEWRGRLKRRVVRLGLEGRFIFAGLIPPDEIPRYVGIMDLLVHLSLREGLPRALPQALAAGKPVIAYDCDGAQEVCVENQTGFLLRPGDRAGLAERVAKLTGDAELRRRLGSRGQEFVKERFSAQRMVDDLHALYLKLADSLNG